MMETTQSTENLTKRTDGDVNNKIQLVLVVISVVIAVVALVVAFVGISQKGTTSINLSTPISTSTGTSDGKIWSIAIGHGHYNQAYIDEETGLLKGFLVDLTNAVCKVANKNCRIVYDVWTRCWDSEKGEVARGGIGLMGDWYDGCAGWLGSTDRYRTYAFSAPWGRGIPQTLFVKPGSPLASSWRDMTGKTVGILDGWIADDACLKRNKGSFTAGVPLTDAQVVHFDEPPDLLAALLNGDVDYAFHGTSIVSEGDLERVEGNPELPCELQGPAMMTRKINTEFLEWWNAAQSRVMASPDYKRICQDLTEEHGDQPGHNAEELCFL